MRDILKALWRGTRNKDVGILLVGAMAFRKGKRGHKRQEIVLGPPPPRSSLGTWRNLDRFEVATRQRIETT